MARMGGALLSHGGGGVGMSSLLSGQLVIPRKCSQEINNGYF